MSIETKYISWKDLLGKDENEFTPEARRARWEEWKALCRAGTTKDQQVVDWWTSHEGCFDDGDGDCRHRDGDWCCLMQLPASVNPRLTYNLGMIGMACMGAGYEPKGGQRNLFEEEA